MVARPTRSFVLHSLVLALAGAPGALVAQTSALVDEGSFMVTRGGTALGRESFRIVRAAAPGGQVFEARSQSALGRRRITTILGTDSAGVPVSYQAQVSVGAKMAERLQGRGRPGRFSVLVQTESGEAAREYVLSNGALLIDDDIVHQYHFLPVAGAHDEFSVIVPRARRQDRFRFEARGEETIEVGGRRIASRKFALVPDTGAARELWFDDAGRLLKVVIPDKNLVALRDDPPL